MTKKALPLLRVATQCWPQRLRPFPSPMRPKKGFKQVRCSYQFLDVGVGRDKQGKVDADALREQLESTLSAQGVTGVRILGQYPWDYFYQFSQEDLVKGLPWELVEMQGNNRTFYIGSSACFESVNDVTNYNVMLAEHFFES